MQHWYLAKLRQRTTDVFLSLNVSAVNFAKGYMHVKPSETILVKDLNCGLFNYSIKFFEKIDSIL